MVKGSKMNSEQIARYISQQVDGLYPDDHGNTYDLIRQDIKEAFDRLHFCMDHVKIWRGTEYHPLHSEKNTVFLYYLANTIWRNRKNTNICEKLFYLNKTLNGFHCFYETNMPDIFFVGHSLGIVLVNMTYPRYLVLYQGTTVGKNHGKGPIMEEGNVLYPGSSIIGECHIRARSYISQNTSVINHDTPGNCLVFSSGNLLTFKPPGHDILGDFFYFD
jgi:serine O-acetyltransferase